MGISSNIPTLHWVSSIISLGPLSDIQTEAFSLMGHSCEKRERRRNENGHVPQWTVPAFRIFRRAHCFPRASSVDNGHVCEQFSTQPTHTHTHTRCTYTATVAPESGLRPHSWGGCIIVTGFRSLAVKQFHAVNRKCNRRRVSILVSRQFTRHTKDNALQEQFLPMRTLSPLTQAPIAKMYCCVRVL